MTEVYVTPSKEDKRMGGKVLESTYRLEPETPIQTDVKIDVRPEKRLYSNYKKQCVN